MSSYCKEMLCVDQSPFDLLQDEAEEEIEEEESYLDLAGMKQQSQLNVMKLILSLPHCFASSRFTWAVCL